MAELKEGSCLGNKDNFRDSPTDPLLRTPYLPAVRISAHPLLSHHVAFAQNTSILCRGNPSNQLIVVMKLTRFLSQNSGAQRYHHQNALYKWVVVLIPEVGVGPYWLTSLHMAQQGVKGMDRAPSHDASDATQCSVGFRGPLSLQGTA